MYWPSTSLSDWLKINHYWEKKKKLELEPGGLGYTANEFEIIIIIVNINNHNNRY